MKRRFPLRFRLSRVPRFVSFDAGVVVGLLGIAAYMAVMNRHWIAAGFLLLAVLAVVMISLRTPKVR
jgi:hypothetical protein